MNSHSARVVPFPNNDARARAPRRPAYVRLKDALHELSNHPTSADARGA